MSKQFSPDMVTKVAAAIEALPELQRTVVHARCIDRLTYDQISALTGLSRRELERQIARAVCNLDRYASGEKPRWWHRWF